MDNLMTGDMDTINVRACPFCRKPIINTFRYKDIVNNMFRKEINPIKEKVHGKPHEINREKQKLLKNMANFSKDHGSLLKANPNLLLAFEQLQSAVKTQKKESLQKLKMQTLYLNILDMITQCYQKYNVAKLSELSDEFHTQVKILCRVLRANTQKISPQFQIDIGNELKRMNSIIQLSQILSHDSYKSIRTVSEVVTTLKLAKDNVLSWRVFREDEAVNALEKLQKVVNVHGIVSKQERDMIVQIIASKAGSWYKCPNGHPYCIADCGGAMVVSKCADCGAAIGGTDHRLLATNSHAGEMDGSRHAAWSNAYDNMANFDL